MQDTLRQGFALLSAGRLEEAAECCRRVLGAISNEKDVGDVTTLANPEIVEEIKEMAKN